MEYQNITNLLDDITNQLSKSRTRNWLKQIMNQKESTTIVRLD